MITFRNLHTFVHVAELGSFTRAAEKLYLTQPAVSAQIKSLEEDLGLCLLERNERNVILTDAGRLVLAESKQILAAYLRLEEKLDALKGVQRGRLVLGASTIPGEYILPRLLGIFRKKYPGVKTALQIGDTDAVLKLLQTREIDLGFVGAPPVDDSLSGEPVLTDELIVIAPPGAASEVSLAALVRENIILREEGSGTRRVFLNLLAQKAIAPADMKVAMELGSTRAVITAVEAGLGISIVSRWAAREAIALGQVIELVVEDFPLRRNLFMVLPRSKYISHALGAFIELVREEGPGFG